MKSDYFQEEIKEQVGKRKKFIIKKIDVIKEVTDDQPERVRAIHNLWENKMNYENSEYDSHFSLRGIFYQRVKNYCNIFNSFNLIGTVLAIAHGKNISIYSILTEKWIKLFTFDSEIVSIFRSAGKTSYITVLLANNKLKVIRSEKRAKEVVKGGEDDQEPWVEVSDRELNLTLPPGKVS